LGYDINLDHI